MNTRPIPTVRIIAFIALALILALLALSARGAAPTLDINTSRIIAVVAARA